MLWLYAIVYCIALLLDPEGSGIPKRADLVANFAFPLVISSWVVADARKRGRQLCYDYDSFIFFLWPVLTPVYLFQTRGVKGLITLLCFAGIWLVATFAAVVLSLIREFASS